MKIETFIYVVIQMLYMYHRIVADSSSLILLAKSGLIDHFVKSSDILIPKSVYKESVEKGKAKGYQDSYKLEKLLQESKIKIKEPSDKTKKRIESLCSLYLGEKDTLALALEENIPVICDDKKGINACKVLGIKFTTALNILLALFNKRKISKNDAITALEKLKEFGWYSYELVEAIEKEIKGE